MGPCRAPGPDSQLARPCILQPQLTGCQLPTAEQTAVQGWDWEQSCVTSDLCKTEAAREGRGSGSSREACLLLGVESHYAPSAVLPMRCVLSGPCPAHRLLLLPCTPEPGGWQDLSRCHSSSSSCPFSELLTRHLVSPGDRTCSPMTLWLRLRCPLLRDTVGLEWAGQPGAWASLSVVDDDPPPPPHRPMWDLQSDGRTARCSPGPIPSSRLALPQPSPQGPQQLGPLQALAGTSSSCPPCSSHLPPGGVKSNLLPTLPPDPKAQL